MTADLSLLAEACMFSADTDNLCMSSPVGVSLTNSLSDDGSVPGFSGGILAAEGLLNQQAKWLLYNSCIEAPSTITITMLLEVTSAAGRSWHDGLESAWAQATSSQGLSAIPKDAQQLPARA